MPHTVNLDDDIFAALQRRAEPLVDDINSVLRKLLGSDVHAAGMDDDRPARNDKPRKEGQREIGKRSRAPKGSLLAEDIYELPILKALAERGGRAPSSEVIDAVGEALADQLGAIDREELSSGSTRWRSRAQFVRLRLVNSGDMAGDSPRGTWEITAQGERRLKAEE